MINEVNKLIFNAIIKYQAVYLPDVGTISVVRYSATLGKKDELLPPRYQIEYSSYNRAKSLIDIISNDVDVDAKRAEEIYSRWLDKAREGSVVVIDGVGTLRDRGFTIDDNLYRALNAYSQPICVPCNRTRTPLFILLAVVVLGIVCVGGWWYSKEFISYTAAEVVMQDNVVEPIVETPVVEGAEQLDVEEVVEEVVVAENKVVDWRENQAIRHWFVVGSYSTTENAERAISEILKRFPESQCDYFKLGSMYAVALFGSTDLNECQNFKRAHSDDFPQSWIYTPKKYR